MKVVHIFNDGTTIDTPKDCKIPFNETTQAFYLSIANHIKTVNQGHDKKKTKVAN